MRRRMWIACLGALCLGRVTAQDSTLVQAPPAAPQPPVRPTPPAAPPVQPPPPAVDSRFNSPGMLASAEAQAAAAAAPVLSATPRMIGDLPGYFGYGAYTVRYCLAFGGNGPGNGNGPTVPGMELPNLPDVPINREEPYAKVEETFNYAALALARGSFKVGENEPVRPTDRVFVSYHYYHQIPNQFLGSTGILTPTATSPFGTPGTNYVLRDTLAATLQNNPAVPPASLVNTTTSATNLHRQTIGFEKTFFDGNFSFGMRLPFFQTDQVSSNNFDPNQLNGFTPFQTDGVPVGVASTLDRSRVGDLTMIFKYAAINEDERVLSGGLVVTAPTGGGILLNDGSRLYSTLLQPWVGAYRAWDRVFVHGFSSLAVPTDHRDITLFFNDIGVGYFLYRAPENAVLTSLTPTFEVHVNTPLDNQRDGGISSPDSVIFTGGMHIGIGPRAFLTLGAATPVTGPRLNQVEGIAQFNWLF